MMARLLATALWLLLYGGVAFAQATCVTPVGSCEVGQSAAAQGQCFCATANGLVAGTIAAAGGAIPQHCCTPSGRFGPYPNAAAAVGQPCQATLPNGTTMTGQACF